ncbi:hypothetical protein AtEden1_Chr2g0224371 [Arabidopsis thaliana]
MALSSSSISLNNLTVTINYTIFDYQTPLRLLSNFQRHLLLSHIPHGHHHRILFHHNLHQICNLCYVSRNHHLSVFITASLAISATTSITGSSTALSKCVALRPPPSRPYEHETLVFYKPRLQRPLPPRPYGYRTFTKFLR